jgi:hypothetical protein
MAGMNGNTGKGTLGKRLEQAERQIHLRQARFVVVEIDGNNADQSEAEADNVLHQLGVTDADLVIYTKHYGRGDGDPALPRLISVAPL